ncbi:MAG: hypothetical protein DRQ55_13230 [Planctomycetota bacterium]|nr:MAG: hypothetical protein DRQ55_13230 [Planctomycetota bacterium]
MAVGGRVRADHLNTYGYERNTSPQIASFAARGVVFENAFSQAPWTLPSIDSVFTGAHPARHGVVHQGLALAPDSSTVSGIMQAEGYYTVAFHDGGYLNSAQGFHHHFDRYERINGMRSLETVVRWLDEHRDLPFFMFLHTYDVHAPYGSVPKEYRERFAREGVTSQFDLALKKPVDHWHDQEMPRFEPNDYERMRDLYDGEIRFVDDQLGRLFSALDDLDLEDRTHVILVSDHGEEFGEHGKFEHHNGNLYRELSNVPLIWVGPGVAGGRSVKEVVQTIDILPTVLDRLGIDPLAAGDIDGRSLGPLLDESGPSPKREGLAAFSETHERGRARSVRSAARRRAGGIRPRRADPRGPPGAGLHQVNRACDGSLSAQGPHGTTSSRCRGRRPPSFGADRRPERAGPLTELSDRHVFPPPAHGSGPTMPPGRGRPSR